MSENKQEENKTVEPACTTTTETKETMVKKLVQQNAYTEGSEDSIKIFFIIQVMLLRLRGNGKIKFYWPPTLNDVFPELSYQSSISWIPNKNS